MSAPRIWRLPHSRVCFVCGEDNRCGLNIRFLTDGLRVWTTLTPRETHMGYAGITHGGVLTAVLDEAMGWAPAVRTGRFCMAIELQLELRRSVPIGQPMIVVGEMTDASRRIWEGRGVIRDAEGVVYVRGAGRFMPMSREKTDQVMDMLIFDDGTVPRELLASGSLRRPSPSEAEPLETR